MTDLLAQIHELESIVENRDRSRIPDLVDLLSPRPSCQLDEAVCWALGRLSGPDEVPLLESLLVKSLYAGVSHLAQAVVRLGGDEDLRRLVALLLERHRSIGTTLGGYHLRFPGLVPFVEPYGKSSDWRIRNEARNFLDRQQKPVPRADLTAEASPALPEEIAHLLARLAVADDPAAVQALLEYLDTLSFRSEAAEALALLLERSADRLPAAALEKVIGHPTWILDCWRYEHEFGFCEGVLPVDLSRVKHLAAVELARRKGQA